MLRKFNPISRIFFDNPMKYISCFFCNRLSTILIRELNDFTAFDGEPLFHSHSLSAEKKTNRSVVAQQNDKPRNIRTLRKVAIFDKVIRYLTVEKISYNHRPQKSAAKTYFFFVVLWQNVMLFILYSASVRMNNIILL